MPGVLADLRRRCDLAWANLSAQLQGMGPYLDRSDAPGEWTTREVLSHLLGRGDVVNLLKAFTSGPLDAMLAGAAMTPGDAAMTPERRTMTLVQLRAGLEAQRVAVFAYLEGLPEADLQARKLRIPQFAQILGTEDVPLGTFAAAMFDFHWNNHAGQLAKIRKAVGLPAR
jgi:hypothetical protein